MQEVQENVPLAPLTTFGIGGNARYLVDVRSEGECKEAIQWASDKGLKFVVFSGGSNVLIPDGGLNALVIRLKGDLYGVENGMVDAWAGTHLLTLIRSVGKQSLGGWEKLAGIPGNIGGAVRGNAGAFGSEMKDFVVKVRALNTNTQEVKEFSNEECVFSYRHSFFKDHPEWLITRAYIKLSGVAPEENEKLIEETIAERERRHLQNVKAAGSYFMNPVAPQEVIEQFEQEKGVKSREGRVPAGWLIEKAGLKGHRVGGAIASEQHPNYIVNTGDATAHDVANLAQVIKLEVFLKFNIELQEEAAILRL
ncbi:MAG TPA: UDP-N-acetylmuramate dehydrogenase [Candidatus Paceibacterota bacterium]|nr:UDP-N-acetylmuramate dehydrogenase [Candidatus Paceibacterota bacterium]